MRHILLGTLLGASMTAQAVTVFGPTSYTSAADNPVTGSFSYSYLETFEDGLLDTNGLSALGGSVLGPGAETDSVDGDDGVVDGSGRAGHSYYSSGATSLAFSFAAATLGGQLPSVVGLAFTDVGTLLTAGIPCCVADATFEAFDEGGLSLGVVTVPQFGDGRVDGATAEDRFVAIRHAGGISRLVVGFADSVDWEVDHLFYARDAAAVPAPATMALVTLGLLAAGSLKRRR